MSENPRVQFSLLTLLIVTIWLATGVLVFLRSNAWSPEKETWDQARFTETFRDWLKDYQQVAFKTPDGTRVYDRYVMENFIYDSKDLRNGSLFDFGIRDHENSMSFVLELATDETPMHKFEGFIDDNRCVLSHRVRKPGVKGVELVVRFWNRNFPEWWWGHLYRPEVWLFIVLSGFLLSRLLPWIKAGFDRKPSRVQKVDPPIEADKTS